MSITHKIRSISSNDQLYDIQSNKDKITLTELYKLPTYEKEERDIYRNKFIIRNSKGKHGINNNILKSLGNEVIINKYTEDKKEKENKKEKKLRGAFRDKFYDDIESLQRIKMNSKMMITDKLLQNRIIHMNKVVSFWGALCKYSAPEFSLLKFQLSLQKNIKNKNNNKNISYIYTTDFINKAIHEQKIKEQKSIKNHINKLSKIKLYK